MRTVPTLSVLLVRGVCRPRVAALLGLAVPLLLLARLLVAAPLGLVLVAGLVLLAVPLVLVALVVRSDARQARVREVAAAELLELPRPVRRPRALPAHRRIRPPAPIPAVSPARPVLLGEGGPDACESCRHRPASRTLIVHGAPFAVCESCALPVAVTR